MLGKILDILELEGIKKSNSELSEKMTENNRQYLKLQVNTLYVTQPFRTATWLCKKRSLSDWWILCHSMRLLDDRKEEHMLVLCKRLLFLSRFESI